MVGADPGGMAVPDAHLPAPRVGTDHLRLRCRCQNSLWLPQPAPKP